VPAVLSTAVGLRGGYGEGRNGITAPRELEWLHTLLLNYLKTESRAFVDEWRATHDATTLFGGEVAVPEKPLTVCQVASALGGGFTASPECMAVARVLAEGFVLVRAGHAGRGWDDMQEVLLEQVGGHSARLLQDCRADLLELRAAGPEQAHVVPSTENRASLSSRWPFIEVAAVWACVGLAVEVLDVGGRDAEAQLAATFDASVSFVDLSVAVRHPNVLESWRGHGGLDEAIRRGCLFLSAVYAQPSCRGFGWLQASPALYALDVVPERAAADVGQADKCVNLSLSLSWLVRAHTPARARTHTHARTHIHIHTQTHTHTRAHTHTHTPSSSSSPSMLLRYARTVAKIDLVKSGAMGQLSFVLRQAPTLSSSQSLLTQLCAAAASGVPLGAAQELREALRVYLAEYSWPKNAREKDVGVALDVLASPVAGSGMIATGGGLALIVAQAFSRGGHGDKSVVALFAHLLSRACKYCDEGEVTALTAEFGQWASETQVRADGLVNSDRLLELHKLFSALLRKTFPRANGTEIEGTSADLSRAELSACV
jgi:hypothetical protein